MAGFSRTTILGNVGRDPQMRYLASGRAVCNVSVAVTKVRGANAGERTENTVWYDVAFWGDLAETANSLLRKGKQVLVDGELLEPRAYTNKAGEPAASNQMTGFSFQLCGPRDDGAHDATPGDSSVDDIPF